MNGDRERWNERWARGEETSGRWLLLEAVRDWLPRDGRVLVLACGPRPDLGLLPSFRVRLFAADVSDAALRRARRESRLPALLVQADGGAPPFRERTFDAVLVRRFYLPSLADEVRRLLRPGGLFVLEAFGDTARRSGRPVRPEWTLARRAVHAGFEGFSTLLAGHDDTWSFYVGRRAR